MEKQKILSHVDHTLLKAFSTWEQIKALCDDAITYKTASVCIPPSFVQKVKEVYGDKLTICTVVGFPLGYNTTESKVFEAQDAVSKGATEVDMVINIGAMHDEDYNYVENEVKTLRQAVPNAILKVIIETCYLSEKEKIKACEIVTRAKADYIKTSTGFGTGGATIEDIKLFKKHIGSNVKMKAAGGVKSPEDLERFLNEGCQRIGTSSAVEMLK